MDSESKDKSVLNLNLTFQYDDKCNRKFNLTSVYIDRAKLADFDQVAALHEAHMVEEGSPVNKSQMAHLKSVSFSDKEPRFVV